MEERRPDTQGKAEAVRARPIGPIKLRSLRVGPGRRPRPGSWVSVNFSMSEDDWQKVREFANRDGDSFATVLRQAVREYCARRDDSIAT